MIWVMYAMRGERTVGLTALTCAAGERVAVDYTEVLRLLALNDEHFVEECSRGRGLAPIRLDQKTLALVRLAALVAVGGAVPSYGAATDAAVSCGATTAEMVDVLVGVIPVVGLPSVVAAAPSMATALGYDITEALEQSNRR
jgi:alkylhydroperoxidase/carboxymuconolactone decarboxylase family protein YurZ